MGGAHTYLKRAEQLDPKRLGVKLALAALHLRRGDSEKAVALYLAVLEERPRDALARRGLAFLRQGGLEERVPDLVDSGRIARFYPRAPGLPPWAAAALTLVLLAVAAAAIYPAARALYAKADAARAPRPEIAAIALGEAERKGLVGSGGSYRYILTEAEALASFERAKTAFQQYRDNAALVEINRLLGSNVGPGVKDKARALKAYVQAPDWRTLRDAPSYADVLRDPGLYEGCAVAWKGRAANVLPGAAGTLFDFLVGYDTKRRLEGIVPALIADPSVAVPAEKAFEFLALIAPAGAAGPQASAGLSAGAPGSPGAAGAKQAGFSLQGVAIHELSEE
ncbi:MAG: tetratricopeptide repeat protein, partial [Spirochaetaceae bacterium]|nr:tetratricopeptide repeat protein [Spirochaetaceae bacterium]